MLSDPNKKRQYDLHGEEGSVAELSSINVEDLGTVGRLFGALISKPAFPFSPSTLGAFAAAGVSPIKR